MLDDVHHEQRIPLSAFMDEGGERGADRPPKPSSDIRRDVFSWEQLQAQFHTLPTPQQLLHYTPQRMCPDHHLHRAIGAQYQQPRRGASLRQGSQALDRSTVTPM